MIAQLDKHEQGHSCFALGTFEKIKQGFLGASGIGKTKAIAQIDLNNKVLKVYDDEIKVLNAQQAKYDKETSHGRITVEQEKYNQLIGEKCNQIYPKE